MVNAISYSIQSSGKVVLYDVKERKVNIPS